MSKKAIILMIIVGYFAVRLMLIATEPYHIFPWYYPIIYDLWIFFPYYTFAIFVILIVYGLKKLSKKIKKP